MKLIILGVLWAYYYYYTEFAPYWGTVLENFIYFSKAFHEISSPILTITHRRDSKLKEIKKSDWAQIMSKWEFEFEPSSLTSELVFWIATTCCQ